MSGYTPCACRDCMDVAVGGMCLPCKEADCVPHGQFDGRYYSSPGAYDCQRDDAYGEA